MCFVTQESYATCSDFNKEGGYHAMARVAVPYLYPAGSVRMLYQCLSSERDALVLLATVNGGWDI